MWLHFVLPGEHCRAARRTLSCSLALTLFALLLVGSAQSAAAAVQATMTGDIQVYLRGGNYPVTSVIEFVPGDSGTNGHRVRYSAYPGETPVLDAGVRVTGWTQQSGNIWKAPLSRANKLRALYVNDKRASMASKTINSLGCQGTYTVTAGQAPWAWESGTECDGSRYNRHRGCPAGHHEC